MERIPILEQRIDGLEERIDKVENRQREFEKLYQLHREEFVETRTYVKQSYQKLDEIRLGIASLEKTTNDRIDQQAKHYRDELKGVQEALNESGKEDKPDEDSSRKQTFDFAWKVVAGVLALATAILGLIQYTNGGTP